MAKSWKARLARGGRLPSKCLQDAPSWTVMLAETDIRQRLEQENSNILKVLDHLQTVVVPFTDGKGWTVFNDWLDQCYNRLRDRWPQGLSYIDRSCIRRLVFRLDQQPA
jgi:hypothetical protein